MLIPDVTQTEYHYPIYGRPKIASFNAGGGDDDLGKLIRYEFN